MAFANCKNVHYTLCSEQWHLRGICTLLTSFFFILLAQRCIVCFVIDLHMLHCGMFSISEGVVFDGIWHDIKTWQKQNSYLSRDCIWACDTANYLNVAISLSTTSLNYHPRPELNSNCPPKDGIIAFNERKLQTVLPSSTRLHVWPFLVEKFSQTNSTFTLHHLQLLKHGWKNIKLSFTVTLWHQPNSRQLAASKQLHSPPEKSGDPWNCHSDSLTVSITCLCVGGMLHRSNEALDELQLGRKNKKNTRIGRRLLPSGCSRASAFVRVRLHAGCEFSAQ